MNKEKQIEEMADVLERAKVNACATIGSMNSSFGMWYATALYTEGYRKQSENVIEVPCKIGDTVYVVSQGAGFSCVWNVYKSRVTAIHLDRYNKLFVFTETERENVGGYVEVERVFNTKEEAEQALEKIIEKMKGGAE